MTQDPTLPEPIDAAGLFEPEWAAWKSPTDGWVVRRKFHDATGRRCTSYLVIGLSERMASLIASALQDQAAEVVRLRAELEKLKVPDRGFDPAMADSDEEECR